jgi:hypothetical protein
MANFKSFTKKASSPDQALLQQGFYRTLALHGEDEAYRMMGYICAGTAVNLDKSLFNSFPLQVQNRFLARALPFDRTHYKTFVNPTKHYKRLCSFAGHNRREPFGVFGDDTYYLYRCHKALLQNNLQEGIHWLNQHFAFHFSSRYKINDFFYSQTEPLKKDLALIGPLTSVVICAKNEEKYLDRSLISLLNQTWNNIELVFVDDGSQDNTAAIYQQYCDYFPTSQYLKTTGVGLWQAKNLGLKHAQGDFITFHDADDWSHPKKLELHIKPLLKKPRLKATTSLNVRVSENNDGLCTKNAMFLQRLNPSSLMFSRDLLPQIGYFFDGLLAADIEFIKRIQLIFGNDKCKFLSLPLMIGTGRVAGLSNLHHGINGKRMKDWEMWNLLHRHHPEIIKKNLPQGTRFMDYLCEHNLDEIKI